MRENVENPMVLDWYWEKLRNVAQKKRRCVGRIGHLGGPGYLGVYGGIYGGVFVPEKDAFKYALERCLDSHFPGIHKIEWTQEFREMLVEWFYSDGEWIKEG